MISYTKILFTSALIFAVTACATSNVTRVGYNELPDDAKFTVLDLTENASINLIELHSSDTMQWYEVNYQRAGEQYVGYVDTDGNILPKDPGSKF